jgi:hypothetical protein
MTQVVWPHCQFQLMKQYGELQAICLFMLTEIGHFCKLIQLWRKFFYSGFSIEVDLIGIQRINQITKKILEEKPLRREGLS